MISNRKAADCQKCFLYTVHDIVASDILAKLDSLTVCAYWNKDGGPLKWPSSAVTVTRLNCACNLAKCNLAPCFTL